MDAILYNLYSERGFGKNKHQHNVVPNLLWLGLYENEVQTVITSMNMIIFILFLHFTSAYQVENTFKCH